MSDLTLRFRAEGKVLQHMQLLFGNFKNMGKYAAVLGSAVVLLLSLVFGYKSGAASSQSSFAVAQAEEISKALDYFYNDFDRYPTTEEFFDEKVMSTYFSAFPLAQIPKAGCPQTFGYRQISSRSYLLGVCLSKSAGNLQAGWNRLTKTK